MTRQEQIKQLEQDWENNPRWNDIERPYSAEEVVNLRGSIQVEHTLAIKGSEKFWNKLQTQDVVCK